MSAPPYISWLGHGALDLAPPGVFTGAVGSAFLIDADTTAMQGLADRLLNPAGGGAVTYKAVLPVAMISFLDIARCTSGTDIMGWLPGRETAFWAPLLEEHAGDPLRDRFVFWSPYIFISYAIGMVTGREIWGWPKGLAEITVPGGGGDAFSCSTTYFPTLAADTQGVTGPLFSIAPTSGQGRTGTTWTTAAQARDGLIDGFLGGLANVLADGLGLAPQVPCVALKQFREPADPTAACYQAIVDSPIMVTAFSGGGLLTGPYTLEIVTCESHPIVADLLGRAPDPGSTSVPVQFAAWVEVDFQALAGGNIVVGGQAV